MADNINKHCFCESLSLNFDAERNVSQQERKFERFTFVMERKRGKNERTGAQAKPHFDAQKTSQTTPSTFGAGGR